jgi:ribulose-5-phosphate 4-epimerase/fuculose-1-phosphate aldolase
VIKKNKKNDTFHAEVVNQFLLALSFDGCRVWQNQTGVARTLDGKRIIRYGKEGSADITGIIKCKSGAGIRLEVEVKVGKDTLSEEQKSFQKMIDTHGALYIEARNIQETVDQVKTFMVNH